MRYFGFTRYLNVAGLRGIDFGSAVSVADCVLVVVVLIWVWVLVYILDLLVLLSRLLGELISFGGV